MVLDEPGGPLLCQECISYAETLVGLAKTYSLFTKIFSVNSPEGFKSKEAVVRLTVSSIPLETSNRVNG